jgi:RNA polymerase sigma factor (TIGR02999 family)
VADITQILQAADGFDPKTAERILPLVYDELRRLAAAKMAGQPPGQTLQATALVHEAYLRLLGKGEHSWANRRHFFFAAAEAMRHILVDRARRKAALRHGGGLSRQSLDEVTIAAETTDENVVRVNDAIEALATHDSEAAELVKLRFFGGFELAPAAEIIGISERTAKRRWAYARAWLFQELTRTQ